MTHYYLFIVEDPFFETGFHFLKVGIGTSRQCQRDYLSLLAFSVDHGCYFERWSPDVDLFYQKFCASLKGVGDCSHGPLLAVSARRLVYCLRRGYVPTDSAFSGSESQMLSFLDSNYYFFRRLSSAKQR